jgi:photosynthetic reaction center cytochrome c subunit/tetratricopeptide repeat protein
MASRASISTFAAVAALCIAAPAARAQLPVKPENLQVLPKDMATDSVVAVMRGFTMALGVRCTFCHVERTPAAGAPAPGPGGGGGGPFVNFDFKNDEKDHKKIARIMIRMMDSVNTRFLASIPNRDNPPTNVTCMTCHRGLSKPGNIETVLTGTTTRMGIDSAIARYRFLRNDMASGRYNFTEQPVNDVARQLATAGKYDDAIKLLMMNQEFYPNSPNIDFQLAEVYIAKGDKDAGVARLRAMLAKNPNNRQVQARLRQLGVEP